MPPNPSALMAAMASSSGLDSSEASAKIAEWNRRQKDFLEQTGLKADGTRVAVGKGSTPKEAERVALLKQKEIEKYSQYRYNKNGTIVVTDDWTKKEHPKVSAEYKPYAVVDVLSQKGKQTDRMYYDADGRQLRQVSTGAHGNPKSTC